MSKHLYSKLAIILYVLILIGLSFYAYKIFKKQDANPTATVTQQNNDNSASTQSPAATDQQTNNAAAQDSTTAPTDSSTAAADASTTATDNNGGDDAGTSTPVDKNAAPVPINKKVSGSTLASITPEHCSSNCQAFNIDPNLLEYCQEACGISPVQNVANCDGKSGIQKDYCLKDLAITKEDASGCDKINDANIQQSCKSRIAQDAIENQIENQQNSSQAPSN